LQFWQLEVLRGVGVHNFWQQILSSEFITLLLFVVERLSKDLPKSQEKKSFEVQGLHVIFV
jgi:hypothetical protein